MLLEDEIIRRENLAELTAILESLSPDNVLVLSLLDEGERHADIARKLGVSRTAISMKLDALRAKIGPELWAFAGA